MRLNTGALPSMKVLLPRLRWWACQSYEVLGPLPLLIAGLWLVLLVYLCGQLRPELYANSLRLQSVHQQLAVPLPISTPEEEHVLNALSVTEYQQVKALFAILKKHGLEARESRYQLLSDNTDAQSEQLILDIPLTGDYLRLQAALREMSGTLPLQFESLAMARTSPASTQLTMSLRVTLTGEIR